MSILLAKCASADEKRCGPRGGSARANKKRKEQYDAVFGIFAEEGWVIQLKYIKFILERIDCFSGKQYICLVCWGDLGFG